MTKADLVEEVVRVSNVSKKHAEIIVNTVFSSIIEALQQDDKIELRGFGSFRVRRRRSRQGRNPKTGDRVEVPEKRIPYFKPGKELKDLINERRADPARPVARRRRRCRRRASADSRTPDRAPRRPSPTRTATSGGATPDAAAAQRAAVDTTSRPGAAR